jgi:dTDP-4-amino-4,6-dideoxygalactose transaminase
MHISGDGSFTKKCHAFLEKECGVANAFLTTSCTDALEMAALLLDVKPDDEVIVPSFTFVSTINAFTLRGAKPVFVDIRPDTLNIDERLIEATITPRTKVIVVVHYAGVGCEMDAIMAVSQRHGIPVVEDNAHGFLGRYKGRNLGTFGAFATLSFHETKNVICGEGGALLINEPRFVERAEIIRDKGTNRSKYFRGQVDKYSWVDVGSSFLPSDILAAFLFAQLEKRDEIQEKRKQIWQSYYGGLKDWAQENGVRLPVVPEYCEQSYHMFYLLMPSLEQRETLIRHLGEHGISSVFHYLPLHLSEMGRRFGGRPGDCPVTEQVSDRLLRLPFYNGMTQDVIQEVVDTVQKWAP